MSRMVGFNVGYPSADHLKQIIDWTGVPEASVRDPLLQLVSDIYLLKTKGDLEYAISPRELNQFVQQYNNRIQNYNPKEDQVKSLMGALETSILYKFQEQTERELVRKSINDTFDIDMRYRFA